MLNYAREVWNNEFFPLGFWTQMGAFGIYMFPCLLALLFILSFHCSRADVASELIADRGKQHTEQTDKSKNGATTNNQESQDSDAAKPKPASAVEQDPERLRKLDRALTNLLKSISHEKAVNAGSLADPKPTAQEILSEMVASKVAWIIWIRQLPYIVLFTVLPFLLFAERIAGNPSVHERAATLYGTQATGAHDLIQTRKNAVWKSARFGFWIRLFVASIIAFSFCLHICPDGRIASTIDEFVRLQLASETNSYNEFLAAQNTEIAPLLAGMLGWYIHLLTTFYFRSARKDVLGSGIYTLMVQRFLIVLGVSMVVRLAYADAGSDAISRLVLPFIVGIFPTTAWSILVDLSKRPIESTTSASLAALEVVPREKIVRLSEEGIDDVVDLAACEPKLLAARINIRQKAVEDWQDRALMASVVGTAKYEQLKEVCTHATIFLERYEEPDFQKALVEAGIHNHQEIFRILKRHLFNGQFA